jgi:hypothetical protein
MHTARPASILDATRHPRPPGVQGQRCNGLYQFGKPFGGVVVILVKSDSSEEVRPGHGDLHRPARE